MTVQALRSRAPRRACGLAGLLAGLLAALVVVPAAHAADRARAEPLDAGARARLARALDASLRQTWTPGVIAGVWVGDRGWTAVRGVANRRTGRRPTRHDHTRIGSVTKTFTGTLVLQLVDEGRLSLDDTIERWFPELPGAEQITIRQLGSMGSGIASYTALPSLVDRYLRNPATVWTPDELISAGTAEPRLFAPGTGFAYVNTNLLMLGRIVEQVTSQPLARVMRSRLFRPLGMRETTYPVTNRLPRPYWRGYTVQGATGGAVRDATRWSPTFAGAAGQIVSTLGDLRRWTRALGRGTLLRPETQRERLRANPASVAGTRAYLFALGRDDGWLLHSGELPGYNTQVAYLPALDATIVVLANADIAGSEGGNPAPVIFDALARVVAPDHRPGRPARPAARGTR